MPPTTAPGPPRTPNQPLFSSAASTLVPRGRPAAPPNTARWPAAVRSAERLRGTLVPCGPGSRGVGWPDTPSVRLATLRHAVGRDLIVVGRSAAWVWGALSAHGARIECSTRDRRRPPHDFARAVRLRQLAIPDHDLARLGQGSVTVPLRTATDLLRDQPELSQAERIAVRLLALSSVGGRDELAARLRAGPRAGRVLALARWEAL